MKFVELHPRLFIRGHTKSLDPINLLTELRERKIGYILNVAIIPDLYLFGASKTVGITYLHAPMSDSKKIVNEALVEQLVGKVVEHMGSHGVLIHCDSGHNRSNLIAIIALSRFTKEPAAEILQRIRVFHPKALKNPTFEAYAISHGA